MLILTRLILVLFALLAGSAASAQAYPVKPVRVVLGFPAGTNVDVLVRPVAQKMSEGLGQQVVVDNRAGATGIIANEFVAKAAPDGYTLLGAPGSSITASPHLHRKLPYDSLKDLVPVAQISAFPNILVVNPVVPAKNVKELIALARSRPGQLTFGSSGNGSAFHLAGELFKSMAKVDMLHVPYKGGNQALLDVVAGRIDLLFYSLAISQPQIKAGKVRALAVTGLKRDALMPELPTLDESGLRGYDVTGWHGFFVPAGTPRDIVDRLNAVVAKVMGAREIRDLWASQGMEAVA
ncbi:MAG TPA: tripartite tricarboxylate transporter substrate binding protein, partial [Burkholderiales bacterium]|nr:tripartite tricarboxylate transporter substrate binding protein [Burkholderiales bacterium]